MVMTVRIISDLSFLVQIHQENQMNGKRLNECATASPLSLELVIRTMHPLHQLTGNQLR